MSGRAEDTPTISVVKPPRESLAHKLLNRVAPLVVRPGQATNEENMTRLRVKLSNAGIRRENAAMLFVASKTVLAVILGGITLIAVWSTGHTPQHIFGFAALCGGVGFMLPNLWLMIGTKQRAEAIRHGLPDALDLMVISVEAGLGLDAAIQRVGEEMRNVHAELSEEMTMAVVETQIGVPRAEALGNMAQRAGVPEVKALVAVITQAEKFGTSIAKALRNQADSLRVKRRLAAEERAQKTTVKLMLPLVLFIFPAIFVVLLGPAVLQIMRQFMQNGM
jgi:tight adherence protein C